MNTTSALFFVFSAILLAAAFRVITVRSPVHAALYLVLAFFNAACIWMLLDAEFLAIALVLVYVGAVMVLFLFVVMMLDINIDTLRQRFWRHFPLAGTIGAVIAVEMAWVLMRGFNVHEAPEPTALAQRMGNTKVLGVQIFTQYLFPLQVAAVLLLVAIIAAIALTLRRRKDSRFIDPSEQVKVRKQGRVMLIQMEPGRPPSGVPVSEASRGESPEGNPS